MLHTAAEHVAARIVEGHVEMRLGRILCFEPFEHVASDDQRPFLAFEPNLLDQDDRRVAPGELDMRHVRGSPERGGAAGDQQAGAPRRRTNDDFIFVWGLRFDLGHVAVAVGHAVERGQHDEGEQGGADDAADDDGRQRALRVARSSTSDPTLRCRMNRLLTVLAALAMLAPVSATRAHTAWIEAAGDGYVVRFGGHEGKTEPYAATR